MWETREQFERFSEAQIGPITQEVGIPGPPKLTYHDVHNTLTGA